MTKKLIASISFIALIFVTLLLLRGKIVHQEFNSAKWKHCDMNTEKNLQLRWNMMNSLRNDYELTGMTERQITKLLGKPDDKYKTNYSYYLGYTGTGINTGTLYIKFNSENRVSKVIVQQG